MVSTSLTIKNGACIQRASIPNLSFEQFFENLKDLCSKDGKIVQYFGYEEHGQGKLLAVVRTDNLFVFECDAPDEYPSLTGQDAKFNLFEREIAEQYGIIPRDHPWLKSVRFHENYCGKPDVFGQNYQEDIPGNYPYYSILGEEIHEVGVGPVHAGIIEPGHFRFSCTGEKVLHLEIQLGYQHRGVEQLLVQTPPKRWPIIVEGIAGDTTIANSICFSRSIEALSGLQADGEVQLVRCLALELERLCNHIGDLGALSGDVAFLPPASYFGRMRGEFLNMLLLLSGNRFGKGLIRPGRILSGNRKEKLRTIQTKCAGLKKEIQHVSQLLFNAASVLSRFEETGVVSNQCADELGLVGVAGRASGLNYDVRASFPTDYYLKHKIDPQVQLSGDVYARAKVRLDEIIQSMEMIAAMELKESNGEEISGETLDLQPSSFVVTLSEGWRGELAHAILTDETGKLLRYKIKDPSFHNWNGLAQALRGEEISDFPLCNKSFNLSYCGFDL
ncbi:NADH-quinone oxidoreductase subunit C [bacterium]|nr:NADH-quinone oxidoreductase subunit C [bacterium]